MPRSLLERLGCLGANYDRRLVGGLLATALALYSIGYATFFPRVFTNDDEARYAAETRAVLETGSPFVPKQHPIDGTIEEIAPGDYPIGMIVLMAPFVSGFGWRGAFVPSFLCLLVAVLVTARWLVEERRSPIFAFLLLGFPAVLVAGRLAMSDTARTAAVAIGLWFFFRGLAGPKRWWLASGLVAGAALSLRESTVLPFIPFFLGAVLRRDRGWTALLLGGLIGTGLHLAGNTLLFGAPFFVRGSAFYPFDPNVGDRLWLYLVGLLVLVPGGLVLGLAYRGRRRPEVVSAIVVFFFFYLLQRYGMSESGTLKRVVIALRYFAPLLPLLAFAAAETLPRWLQGSGEGRPVGGRFLRVTGGAVGCWIAVVCTACLAVHPVLASWSASQAEIRDAIDRTVPRDAVMIGNGVAVQKFIDEYGRDYVTLSRRRLSPDQLTTLRTRHDRVFLVLLDRSDSEFWRKDAASNADFVRSLGDELEPLVDLQPTRTDRLRIWRWDARATGPNAERS